MIPVVMRTVMDKAATTGTSFRYLGLPIESCKTGIGTAQVAPTVLKALHIDPTLLNAVRLEGTGVLPAVQLR